MNFAQVKGISIPQGTVKQLAQGQTTLWEKSGSDNPWSKEPVSLTFPSGGSLGYDAYYLYDNVYIAVSVNDGAWTNVTIVAGSQAASGIATLQSGDTIKIKGIGNTTWEECQFTINSPQADVVVAGNILSLLDGSTFQSITSMEPRCFTYLFYGCDKLKDASNFVLPNFLSAGCYQYLFAGAKGLEKAPELPTKILLGYCYGNMFNGCTNLNYIKCLATNRSASGCTSDWVSNVGATGTFVKAAGVYWPSGGSGIPRGWTVQEV